MTSEQWTATFTGLAALAAIVTAVIAVSALRQTSGDSRDRSRPLVVARLKVGPIRPTGYLYLVVQNRGASVARDVRVSFTPALPDAEVDPNGRASIAGPFINRRYAEPLSVLAPGELLSNIYYIFSDDWDEPMPRQCRVEVTYTDDHSRRYSDGFDLDVDVQGQETSGTPGGKEFDKLQAQALQAIVWELWRS